MTNNSRVVSIFGLPISNVGMDRAVASIESRIQSGGRYQIATANLDFVQNARGNPELHRVICDCAMVLPDGFPLVWASKLLGRPLRQRVAGVDLTLELAKLSSQRGYTIFLLGSTDENARTSMRLLTEKFPGVKFAGHYAPVPAPLDQMDDAEILRRIHLAKPDILLVAFGNPKQELWIHRNFEDLDVPISIGVGGTFEMIAGVKRRAPRFIQALNLEWMFRMLQEPGRLLPRYAKDFGALLRYLPREIIANRRQWKASELGALNIKEQSGHRVIQVRGTLTGALCRDIRDAITNAIHSKRDVTIDLSETAGVEPDGLGCLLEVRRSLQGNDLQLYVVGCSSAIQRVIDASSLNNLLIRSKSKARPVAVPDMKLERAKVDKVKEPRAVSA